MGKPHIYRYISLFLFWENADRFRRICIYAGDSLTLPSLFYSAGGLTRFAAEFEGPSKSAEKVLLSFDLHAFVQKSRLDHENVQHLDHLAFWNKDIRSAWRPKHTKCLAKMSGRKLQRVLDGMATDSECKGLRQCSVYLNLHLLFFFVIQTHPKGTWQKDVVKIAPWQNQNLTSDAATYLLRFWVCIRIDRVKKISLQFEAPSSFNWAKFSVQKRS